MGEVTDQRNTTRWGEMDDRTSTPDTSQEGVVVTYDVELTPCSMAAAGRAGY